MGLRLKSLRIENFRALEKMEISFESMSVIIGENDVGKTSCLVAIKTLFHTPKLENDADFFRRDTRRTVLLQATFVDGDDGTVNELVVRCKYEHRKPRVIELRERVPTDERFRDISGQKVATLNKTLLDIGELDVQTKVDKAEALSLLASWVEKNVGAGEREDQWRSTKEPDLKKLLPEFVFIPVNRDLEGNLKVTDRSLFGQLFIPLLKSAILDETVHKSLGILRDKLEVGVAERVSELQTLLRGQMNNHNLELTHSVEVDPIKGISFTFGLDDERVTGIPIANRGAGVHNNLVLAMFRLLAQNKTSDFILAVEEPENSLHPRGQREMLWALQQVAENAQVICTTHSSVFLDLGRLEDNIVLARTPRGNTVARSFVGDDSGQLRDLLGIRISDALLGGGGNCALIVEGDTELHAYPHFFRLQEKDARALGISIISAGGSDTEIFRKILAVLNVYGIPSVAILDKDAKKAADDLRRYVGGDELPCLRKVFLLAHGTFEMYIPLDIAIETINARFPDGEDLEEQDFDSSKNRENEFSRLLHEKKPGARFDHFKVEFGELAGRAMVERKISLDPEIAAIIDTVASIANE